MKKIILMIAMAGLITQAKSQTVYQKDVPVIVVKTFTTSYPNVNDVDWSRDGNYYVAEYDVNETPMYVVYDMTGNYIQSKQKIKSSQLPISIMSYVKTNYKEDEIRRAYKLTDSNGVVSYKVKVKGDYLLFDADGNFKNAL